VQESRFAGLLNFLRFFANPLVVIILATSGISLGLRDEVGGLIIIAIVLLSVLLNYFMEFQARHAGVCNKEDHTHAAAAGAQEGIRLEDFLPSTSSIPLNRAGVVLF
jgi:hypothetical protein